MGSSASEKLLWRALWPIEHQWGGSSTIFGEQASAPLWAWLMLSSLPLQIFPWVIKFSVDTETFPLSVD